MAKSAPLARHSAGWKREAFAQAETKQKIWRVPSASTRRFLIVCFRANAAWMLMARGQNGVCRLFSSGLRNAYCVQCVVESLSCVQHVLHNQLFVF